MRLRVAAILVAILAVTAAPTFAQVTGAVKVGVNFAKASFEEFDEEFSSDMKSGLIVGAAVDVPIAPMFSFQPEFLYNMKGGKNGDLTEGETGVDVKLTVNMIQIPLLFKAGATEGSVRPFIVVGPAFGFVTSAKFKVDFEDDTLDADFEDDIKDDVEKVEISAVFGGGVKFGRGIIEYRYDHGFKDLDKATDSTAKTRTHSILFGISFP